MHDSVTVHMNASADAIWDLVSDVTRIGSYSPETFEAEWLDGATGPAVGARFRGHVKRNGKGPIYWTTCTVTASEPGREFAFAVSPKPTGEALSIWRYQLAPAGDGTDVTESFELMPTAWSHEPRRHAHHPRAHQGRGRSASQSALDQEQPMGVRGFAGAVLLLIGGIWFAQGTNLLKGSPMTGHGQWTVAGAVLLVAGVALILWDVRVRRRPE
jgi:hypothetical protein